MFCTVGSIERCSRGAPYSWVQPPSSSATWCRFLFIVRCQGWLSRRLRRKRCAGTRIFEASDWAGGVLLALWTLLSALSFRMRSWRRNSALLAAGVLLATGAWLGAYAAAGISFEIDPRGRDARGVPHRHAALARSADLARPRCTLCAARRRGALLKSVVGPEPLHPVHGQPRHHPHGESRQRTCSGARASSWLARRSRNTFRRCRAISASSRATRSKCWRAPSPNRKHAPAAENRSRSSCR